MPTTTIKAETAVDSPDQSVDEDAVSVGADEVGNGDDAVADYPVEVEGDEVGSGEVTGSGRWSVSRLGPGELAVVFGIVAAVVLASVGGWLGYQTYQARQAADLRAEFLQVGRQTAVNLTTIDWQHADGDVQRIVDGATGTFYDDFSQRSGPFVEVVKKAQSTSVGTVTAAGVESSTPNDAEVLVAVSVKTTNAGSPEEGQRSWRMRLAVQKVGNDMKVSHVEFVA